MSIPTSIFEAGTPVVSRGGVCLLFQFIFRGRTSRCHPTAAADTHESIVFDHSDSKYQTQATFARLLALLANKLDDVRQQRQLSADACALLIVDGAPSHAGETVLVQVHENVFKFTDGNNLYLTYTLPNRSHTLQVGDRLINLTLRQHTRRAAKLRTLEQALARAEGRDVPADMGESTMKRLLLQLVSGWLRDPRLSGWILESWASALATEPELDSVDDIPGPAAVILLPPPVDPGSAGMSAADGDMVGDAVDGDEDDRSSVPDNVVPYDVDVDHSDVDLPAEEDAPVDVSGDAELARLLGLGLRARRG
eukprot:EG_transcript_14867